MPVRSVSSLGPGAEQRGVAAEPVEDEAGEPLAGRVGDERPRAVEVGERAAAVDVGDEQGGGVGVGEHPVVDEVGEVDLGRAAGALDDDELVLAAQPVERRGHRRPQVRAALAPRHRGEVGPGDAVDDDLAAGVGLRLQQHRVHPHVGLDAGGPGLQPLGDADLAAVDDAGVVRHVLGLERHDVDAVAGEPAAQRRDEPALAGVRRAPEHHQRAHHRTTRSSAATRRARPSSSGTATRATPLHAEARAVTHDDPLRGEQLAEAGPVHEHPAAVGVGHRQAAAR